MKNSIKSILAVIACIGFVGLSQAEEAARPAAVDQHHASVPDTKKGQMGKEIMGGQMNMDGMHTMMGECMKMHNDGKMCDNQMMENCKMKMDKGECKKMMRQAKAHEKMKANEATKK